MAEQKTFRSAFRGFNRQDVVRYIEYLGTKHKAQINQLNSEVEFLRGKLAEAQRTPAADPGTGEQLDALQAQLETLTREKAAAEAQRDQALAENVRLKAEAADALAAANHAEAARNAALQQVTVQQNRSNEELEAYRRAERTERLAKERAQQLYRQANAALADATVKVDEAADQIGQLSERCISQLELLRAAVTGSKEALKDAATTMYTIRPEREDA